MKQESTTGTYMKRLTRAAKLLAEPKHYHRWMSVFALLSACLLLPAISPTGLMPRLWELFRRSSFSLIILFFLALALSFFWFQNTGTRGTENTLPKRLLPLLLLLSVAGVITWAVIYLVLFRPETLTHATQQAENHSLPYFPVPVRILIPMLKGIGFLSALAGEYGLIQARLIDRRWRAVYALGITTCMLSLAILMILTSMSFPLAFDWHSSCLRSCILWTAVGLIGTGVSLC